MKELKGKRFLTSSKRSSLARALLNVFSESVFGKSRLLEEKSGIESASKPLPGASSESVSSVRASSKILFQERLKRAFSSRKSGFFSALRQDLGKERLPFLPDLYF